MVSGASKIFAQSSTNTTTLSSSSTANSNNSASLASSSLFLSSFGNQNPSKQTLQQTTTPSSGAAVSAVATNSIRIPQASSVENGQYYQPLNARVPVGSNVTWMNDDFAIHTATANNAVFDTGHINPGAHKLTKRITNVKFVELRKIHYNVMSRVMDMNEADILAGRAKSVSARHYALYELDRLTDAYHHAWEKLGIIISNQLV